MAASRFHEDVEVFFLLGVQPSDRCCRPRVDFTIDEDHLRVVLLQELGDFLAQSLVPFHELCIFGEYQFSQIILGALDDHVVLERTHVVTIVAQFTAGLYEEGCIRTVYVEVGRVADGQEMLEDFFIAAVQCRNGADRSTPLPQGERIFQYGKVVYLSYRSAELVFLFSAMLLEERL